MVSASDGDGFVVRQMATALWCVGWRRLCGASEMRPMRLKRPSPADEADGARVMRPMMLKRPSPAGEADEAEEAVTGVTSK